MVKDKNIIKKIFLQISSHLKNIFHTGIHGSMYESENRTTLYTNLMAAWGMLSIFPIASFLESNGIHISVYGVPYVILFLSGLYVFKLNYSKKYLQARLLGLLAINLGAWQAAIFFGKTFNGYLLFFVAVFYSILSMARAPVYVRAISFILTFLGLPLVDYLSFHKIVPITGFDSKNFGFSLLIVDTIFTVGFISIIMYVEKLYSIKYEDELSKTNENLEELVRVRSESLMKEKEENLQVSLMRSQFLANISHELRIPMQGILGYVGLGEKNLVKVKETLVTNGDNIYLTKLERSFVKINESMMRLLDLIERLFKITESGQYKAHPSSFNLKEALQSVVKKLEVSSNKVILDVDASLNKLVFSDAVLLQQSLVCLLDNAISFSNHGTDIKVSAIIKDQHVNIEVINQGLGIADKEESAIFEAFFQGSLSDDRTGGTGIGLTLCRKYMSTIGGDVKLKDSSPMNTCFVLSFPEHYFSETSFEKVA